MTGYLLGSGKGLASFGLPGVVLPKPNISAERGFWTVLFHSWNNSCMASPLDSLISLGFTPLEAEVYVCLVQDSPATGYRIAQTVGRPVAGIYKTIESLANKGAVVLDEGESRLCRAIPPVELLTRLEREFQAEKTRAAAGLAKLKPPPEDDRVYQLRTVAQVEERARMMIERAKALVLVDVFPGPLERLTPNLQAAVEREVKVAVQAYAPFELSGALVTQFPPTHPIPAGFPGQWLILVVDGAELLLAYYDRECSEISQAVHTRSPFFSLTLMAFMCSEFSLTSALHDPEFPSEARNVLRRHASFFPLPPPGFTELLRRLGHDPSDELNRDR